MLIPTTRFGDLDIDEQRILRFSKGLLGFPAYKRYVLIEAGQDSYFWWLQAVDAPELAFIVTDPSLFVPTYRVPVRAEQLNDLGIQRVEDAQTFVIVNKRGQTLTGNLQGPLVVHVQQRVGEQLVLSDRRFSTRVPLIELGEPQVAAARSA